MQKLSQLKSLKPLQHKLRLFGYEVIFNIRKYRKILITLAIIIILVFGFNFFTLNAKPGDLFFTVKLFYEKAIYPVDSGTTAQKLSAYAGLIADRANSYTVLYGKQDCVQLLLAEQELTNTLKQARNVLSQASGDEYAISSQNFYNIVLPLSQLSSGSCPNSPVVAQLSFILRLESISKGNLLEVKEVMAHKSDLEKTFNDLRQELKTTSISSQEELTDVNNLLLLANTTIQATDTKAAMENQLDTAIKLHTADLALINAKQVLTKTKQVTNWYDTIFALCTIVPDIAGCDKPTLAGKINSIESLSSVYSRVEQGETVFREYFSNLGK